MIRPLRLAGIPCAVVAASGDAAGYSAGVQRLFDRDWSGRQEEHDGLLADRLEAWALTQPVPPVLFHSSDQPMLFVSRFRDRLARGFRFVVPERVLVEALADRLQFAAPAARLGLPVPA